MNQDEQIIQNSKDIAALRENLKSAHKRIDENDSVTKGIHELSTSIAAIAVELRALVTRYDTSFERIEAGQKSQGERIGALEKKPAMRWEALVTQLIGLLVAAVAGGMLSKFI